MRVLLITRKGIWSYAGGEQTQIRSTRRHLEALGVEVAQAEEIPQDYRRYDLIHFFALDRDHIDKITAAHGITKVLSPIYWDRYQSYGDAGRRRPPWLARRLAPLRRWQTRRREAAAQAGGRAGTGPHLRPIDTGGLRGYSMFQDVVDLIDFCLPNSEMEMESVRRNYIFLQSPPYAVVHNAIDPDALDERSDYYQRRFGFARAVLCSAAIEVRKNQCGLVASLDEHGIPIILAGQVRDEVYCTALNQLLRERPNVHLTGHLETADLNSLYAQAAVHALPSFHETPGISNLEAIAHGCPNVSTKIGGLQEYVGPHSLYCNPYHVPHIRHQVLAALDMPRNEDGAAFVRNRYTWANTARETIAAYEQALSLGKPRH